MYWALGPFLPLLLTGVFESMPYLGHSPGIFSPGGGSYATTALPLVSTLGPCPFSVLLGGHLLAFGGLRWDRGSLYDFIISIWCKDKFFGVDITEFTDSSLTWFVLVCSFGGEWLP